MQSLSLKVSKRLSTSKPLFGISSNLVPHASSSITTTSSSSNPPPSPPVHSAVGNGGSWPSSALHSLLRAPWSANQSRGITLPGSDVRAANSIRIQGGIHEVLLHRAASYATAATTGDAIKRVVRDSGLRKEGPKTKREQLLKATAVAPLVMIYPNAYSLFAGNLSIFWHMHAGIEEIFADYIHHEMTRTFMEISLRLFLIIAAKDVFLNLVFV
ncbi:unnamed protein product [Cuscuta campestris]|uniref:Succinate dehydrogenase subunit 4, mitochondrial n=1 Tax=Cuscuta campestris TaxID=132261 RepID=A0A484N9K4_9ASTE|nr:unnamed protein product [Cuscuta campestris]